MKILVCIPIKPSMNAKLKGICIQKAHSMVGHNPDHAISFLFDYSPIGAEPKDYTPWSRVTRARNMMLDKINVQAFDYLLWIDADVVEYPPDMPSRLIAANPRGVTAPLILIEGSDRFYDWAAFVIKGKSHIEPTNKAQLYGRNLRHEPPYWPNLPTDNHLELDCVGTVTLVSTDVYMSGARYVDHPSFTDHFSICEAAKSIGGKVVCVRDCVARHADLPKYGEQWH